MAQWVQDPFKLNQPVNFIESFTPVYFSKKMLDIFIMWLWHLKHFDRCLLFLRHFTRKNEAIELISKIIDTCTLDEFVRVREIMSPTFPSIWRLSLFVCLKSWRATAVLMKIWKNREYRQYRKDANEDKGLDNSSMFLFVLKARKILSNWFRSEFTVILKAHCTHIFSDVLDTFLPRYLGLHFFNPSNFISPEPHQGFSTSHYSRESWNSNHFIMDFSIIWIMSFKIYDSFVYFRSLHATVVLMNICKNRD